MTLSMVKKRAFRDLLKVLVLLLDEAVVLVLIFLLLNYYNVQIPLPVTIFVLLVIAVLVFIIHIKVIPSFHWKQVTGREGMIGSQGIVVEALTPVGTISVRGELWKAISVDGGIEVNEDVKVVGMERLTLKVVRLQED